jgi:hypothetical protein
LAHDLTKLKINENNRIMTYDMKDLYVNIPIQETLTITKSMLIKENNIQIKKQIINLLEIILKQSIYNFKTTYTNHKKEFLRDHPYLVK